MKSSSVLLRNSFKTFISIPEMHKPRCLKLSPYAPLLQPSQLHFPCLTDFHFCPSCIFSFIFFFPPCHAPVFLATCYLAHLAVFIFMCVLGNFTMPQKAFTWRGEVVRVTINKRHHPLINNIMDIILFPSPIPKKKKIRLTIHFRALGSINCFY